MIKEGVKLLGKNRKAYHEYFVDESIECGLALQGTEVKSIRKAHFNFSDSYARIRGGELWLLGFHINPFAQGNMNNHEPDRDRKLLIHSVEREKLRKKVDEKGYTLVPLSLYLKNGLIKLELGVCKGKKNYDKRQVIKQKDLKRETDRELRGRG
ncbi:MAG: SsrA-binding protein SmpB [Spirochaetales bacterium]|nr:SsrA-binding protein SmpB [Spirochaetales bacterium]